MSSSQLPTMMWICAFVFVQPAGVSYGLPRPNFIISSASRGAHDSSRATANFRRRSDSCDNGADFSRLSVAFVYERARNGDHLSLVTVPNIFLVC